MSKQSALNDLEIELDTIDEMLERPARDQTRYKPRHAWYLADAQLLVRELQAVCWPLFHHVALGGGVLNHGYSGKDVPLAALRGYQGADHRRVHRPSVNQHGGASRHKLNSAGRAQARPSVNMEDL